jgi:hypothetical protein
MENICGYVKEGLEEEFKSGVRTLGLDGVNVCSLPCPIAELGLVMYELLPKVSIQDKEPHMNDLLP